MKRKEFITTLGIGILASKFADAKTLFISDKKFTLPALPYSVSALEPHIDTMTMEIHHGRHHQAYVNNLNNALENVSLPKTSLDQIIRNVSKYGTAVRNNGGGHWNHSFFWQILSPNKSQPSKKLLKQIEKDFGSLENMKAEFNKAAGSRFGSGWAWLVRKTDGSLKVISTPNQDNPLMDIAEEKGYPVIGVDVWEHAYYLKYQNLRGDYVKAFWELVNWKQAEKNYKDSKKWF